VTGNGCLDGRVAIVTGASRGIGAALAQRLAAEGARVALVARTEREGDRRLAGSLETTAEAIRAAGGVALTIAADLSKPAGFAEAILGATHHELGPVDVVVNNAGIALPVRLEQASLRNWEVSLNVNLLAPWSLAQACLADLRRGHGGAIVNISSFMAEFPAYAGSDVTTSPPVEGNLYGATKAALNRLTVGLAAELEGSGVIANALSPQNSVATVGAIETGRLPADGRAMEPVETMVEAATALCAPDTAAGSGRVVRSLALLVELDRPVMHLDGKTLMEGWQPADIVAHLNASKELV
jgi:NAD(P)-dependent dehydrogenase (short-subunit alcohol dehydrogenase family)